MAGWLPVGLHDVDGGQLSLFYTVDGGVTWQMHSQSAVDVSHISSSSMASLLAPVVFNASGDENLREIMSRLPEGIVYFDFAGSYGWVVVQSGYCEGDKKITAEPMRCEQSWQLLGTDDGGMNWYQIPLSPTK